jgi:hypothetical protein
MRRWTDDTALPGAAPAAYFKRLSAFSAMPTQSAKSRAPSNRTLPGVKTDEPLDLAFGQQGNPRHSDASSRPHCRDPHPIARVSQGRHARRSG